MITRPIRRLLTLSACLLALQGCGQSGDLYLPGEAPATRPRPETTP